MFIRRRAISSCCFSSMSKTLTWMRWRVSGNQVSTSSEMKKSGRSGLRLSSDEAAVDGVVVGDGHEVHPALLGQAVDLLGPVVGVAGVRDAEVLERREDGVAVQVRLFEPLIGKPARLIRIDFPLRRHSSEPPLRPPRVPSRVNFPL